MKRYDLMGNAANANIPLVTHRMPVAPGTTIKHQHHKVQYRSDLITIPGMNPYLLSVYTFYCPLRLLWEDFPAFIAQDDDFAGTFPTTTTNWNTVLDKLAAASAPGTHSSMARRAFKLFYDQYLGDADFGDAYGESNAAGWDDTDTTDYRLKNTEQIIAKLRDGDDIDNPTFDATTVPIDLNQFAFEMAQARSRRKAQVSGDKYVDALARMGVRLDWKVQNAPELLGKTHKVIRPQYQTGTDATNLGNQKVRFYGNCDHTIMNKRFAEEGLVMTVTGVRPIFGNDSYAHPLDGSMQTLDDFYLGDDPRLMLGYDTRMFTNQTAGTGLLFSQRHSRYFDGHHITASGGDDYFTSTSYGSPEVLLYPGHDVGEGEVADDFNFLHEVQTDLRTPVNKSYG